MFRSFCCALINHPFASFMSTNSFYPGKFQDHTIVDGDGKVVGHVRVKPSGVLWAPVNSKVWYGIGLKTFAAHMETNGKKQKK